MPLFSSLRIKGRLRNILFGVIFTTLFSCSSLTLEADDEGPLSSTVRKLNSNVRGLRELANACMSADSIALFSIQYNGDGSVLFSVSLKNGSNIGLFSEIVADDISVPELSMDKEDGVFYWTVNGVPLADSYGDRIAVTDLTKPLAFFVQNEVFCCKVNSFVVGEYPVTKADDYLARDVAVDFNVDNSVFYFRLSSGLITALPVVSVFHLLNVSVPKRSFYKDVFLDAGIALTSRKTLAAAEYLGLSLEGICFNSWDPASKESALQNAIVSGDSNDTNGFKCYFLQI